MMPALFFLSSRYSLVFWRFTCTFLDSPRPYTLEKGTNRKLRTRKPYLRIAKNILKNWFGSCFFLFANYRPLLYANGFPFVEWNWFERIGCSERKNVCSSKSWSLHMKIGLIWCGRLLFALCFSDALEFPVKAFRFSNSNKLWRSLFILFDGLNKLFDNYSKVSVSFSFAIYGFIVM